MTVIVPQTLMLVGPMTFHVFLKQGAVTFYPLSLTYCWNDIRAYPKFFKLIVTSLIKALYMFTEVYGNILKFVQKCNGQTNQLLLRIPLTLMASQAVPKLFAVTLRRSPIGRPWWTRRTLEALGLKKRNQIVICKSTPSVNGQLRHVKDMVDIKPVVFRTDIHNSPRGEEMLLDNGEFFVSEETLRALSQDVERHLTNK